MLGLVDLLQAQETLGCSVHIGQDRGLGELACLGQIGVQCVQELAHEV